MDKQKLIDELKRNNISCSGDKSLIELEDLFYSLPITDSQIKELSVYGIFYKPEWCWNRRAAKDFLDEIVDYNKLLRSLPVSPQQKAVLMEHGVYEFADMTAGKASDLIYRLPAESEQLQYIKTFKLFVPPGVEITYGLAQSIIRNHKERVFGIV